MRCPLANDLLRLEIDPALGAGIGDLSILGAQGRWWPLLRRAPAVTDSSEELACFLALPWTNRIKNAAFTFRGRDARLRPNFSDGSAIHGDVRHRPWKIVDRSPVSARLRFDSAEHDDANWPWAYTAQVRYELTGASLVMDLSVSNADESAMPVALGFHPFFNRTLWCAGDRPMLRAEVTGRYPSRNVFPTGPARRDEMTDRLNTPSRIDQELDDTFTCPTGLVELSWPLSGVRVRFESSAEFSHLVVYSPRSSSGPLAYFCVEPVSACVDAFNLAAEAGRSEADTREGDSRQPPVEATGTRALEPGESLSARWTLHIDVG